MVFPDEIKINLPENDIMTMCDFNSIEVVFENLLLNAKQAIKGSGIINIRLAEEGNFAKIEVEDSGEGIPNHVLPKIFDPLFTTKQEGTGLGLSSCRNIVEQHGGTIEVKTEIGKGTTFTVKLPITKFETHLVTSSEIEDHMPKLTSRNNISE